MTESQHIANAQPQTDQASAQSDNRPADKRGNSNLPKQNNQTSRTARSKKRIPCKFYATKGGCRAGDQCPFLHDVTKTTPSALGEATRASNTRPEASSAKTIKSDSPVALEPPTTAAQHEAATRRLPPWGQPVMDLHRVVQRPVPKAASQDPRGFQVGQIKRRFRAKEESKPEGLTEIHFEMTPSDPDFPFEIDSLKCVIKLFSVFPLKPPSLRITNKEMERGYQVNVEKGFDLIWRQAANPTLLGAMKELDKKLEQLLTAQKAEVFKIVAPPRLVTPKTEPDLPREPAFTQTIAAANIDSANTASLPKPSQPSAERLRQAKSRRDEEVRILEHRLNRDPQFSALAEGSVFIVSVQPRKRENLPITMRPVKTVQLYVPLTYDIDPCSIDLLGVEGEGVKNTEAAFLKRAEQTPESSLLAQINYLASNMHIMAAQPAEPVARVQEPENKITPSIPLPIQTAQQGLETRDTDKSHVKIIARPPEWSLDWHGTESEGTDDEDSSFSELESGSDDGEDDVGDVQDDSRASTTLRERGIMLSFPTLELHNIELLELETINLTVKCDRCKDTTSISNITNNVLADPPELRSERCKKCAVQFSVGFRRDIMHANSIRAGYLDFEGCTPVDLLTCPFLPTCSQCSTVHPRVSAVRGDAAMAICRECHARLSFTIRETKFLRVSAAAPATVGTLPRKKPKNTLGIVAGTELPRTGRCQHYAKSHRWFRFSCCDKVYPCDRCHDAEEKDHVQEFANRMICGFCSREQNYRPEDCNVCRRVLTGKKGRGFWEGGKGTRDPKKMSRKDPRKYKRRGAGAVKKNLHEKYET